jgi:hypothetical protein
MNKELDENEIFDSMVIEEVQTKSHEVTRDYPNLPEEVKKEALERFKGWLVSVK